MGSGVGGGDMPFIERGFQAEWSSRRVYLTLPDSRVSRHGARCKVHGVFFVYRPSYVCHPTLMSYSLAERAWARAASGCNLIAAAGGK